MFELLLLAGCGALIYVFIKAVFGPTGKIDSRDTWDP